VLSDQLTGRCEVWAIPLAPHVSPEYSIIVDLCVKMQHEETEITRCVAAPRVMAARWVGQNSGPIFRHLWTKEHQIKFTCAGVSVVCNAIFRLTMSCCVPEIFAIKSLSCAKSCGNSDVFGPPNFGRKGPPKFLREFYKSESLSSIEHAAKFGDDRPNDLGD